jgi:predicted O-methyltransferase YrrM
MRPSALDMTSELSAAELAALRSLLGRAGLRGAHLEVGTAAGGTLREMMLCYARPRPRFVAVDPFRYFPDQKAIVLRNLASTGIGPAEAELRQSDSDAALRAATAAGERFEFILIDANHGARHVIRDLRWADLLSPGGYLCLHDYGRFPGVTWAANRFLRRNSNVRWIALEDSLVVIQKIADAPGRGVGAIDILLGEFLSLIHRLSRSLKKRTRLGH